MKSFVVVAPPYTDTSSGVRACYRLVHWLNTLGETAYICTTPGPEKPPREWDIRYRLFASYPIPDDVIAIYPEIYRHNALGAKTVVRWVLNHPGLLGGDTVYDDGEIIFYAPQLTGPDLYRESAQKAAGNREIYPLQTSVHEPHLFYPSKRTDRKGTCYHVYKGFDAFTKSGGRFPLESWRLIGHPGMNVSRVELGELFRRSEAFYSWDHASGITREAAICGCPTFIVDAEGNTTEVAPVDYAEVVAQYFNPPAGIERLIELAR